MHLKLFAVTEAGRVGGKKRSTAETEFLSRLLPVGQFPLHPDRGTLC